MLNQLNPEQRAAAEHRDGPLLILAGAGSGKTKTMAFRIAHLLTAGKVPPSAILGLSFTNKAATELKERVQQMVAKNSKHMSTQGLWITTFHSLCVRILRADGHRIGVQKNFSILDESDQQDVLKSILKRIKIDDRKFDVSSLLFHFGHVKNRMLKGDLAVDYLLNHSRLPQDYALAAASAYPKYLAELRALNAVDFDDLIFLTIDLLEHNEQARNHYNDRFKYILVDEYQDTNASQFRLIRLLTQSRQNICVVGDDDQSIYAWRGADPKHILEFTQHFPGAKVITLERNYRSRQRILDAANEVIAKNKHRHPKKLWSSEGEGDPLTELICEDDRAEAKVVAEEIFAKVKPGPHTPQGTNRRWSDFAVLYRSNSQSRVFEEALRELRIPYKIVGGMSFLERKEVKDVLSYWRLICNPKDDASLRRIINWPTRGIGKTALESLSQYALQNETSLYEAMKHASEIAPRSAESCSRFLAQLDSLRAELQQTAFTAGAVSMWAKKSLDALKIRAAIEADEEDVQKAQRRWENAEELANAIGQIRLSEIEANDPSGLSLLSDYLQRLLIDSKDEKDDEDAFRDEVTLLTLHGAKGLEYPIVFMVGMEDGLLPHQRTIDEGADLNEERRLCYVGITRAKEKLYLTRTRFRIRYGKQVPRNPSRFLDEIPKHLITTQDESITRGPADRERDQAHEENVKNFLSNLKSQLLAKPK